MARIFMEIICKAVASMKTLKQPGVPSLIRKSFEPYEEQIAAWGA